MKAKDLRGRNIEDVDSDSDEPKEEDAVSAAYENISKKLDSIRNGGKADEEESEDSKVSNESKGSDDEPELEEWKGPKPPAKQADPDEAEEDEQELRKVKLHNLEDIKEGSDESKEPEESEVEEDEEKDTDMKPKKDWEPKENDPLDEEDLKDEPEASDESKEPEEADIEKEEEPENETEEVEKSSEKADDKDMDKEEEPLKDAKEDEMESVHSDAPIADKAENSDNPDTLDDLADDSPFGEKGPHKDAADSAEGSDRPREPEGRTKPEDELPYNRDTAEDDYSIPNLKAPRQEGSNMGYNAPPPREGIGQSYSPRGNMDGNDPNNFFSQHQPQPGKRANKFHLLVLVVIGIAVIGFTVYILKGGFGDIQLGSQPSPSPSATATPVPTPTATPEPEVDRGSFTVKVLNGTTTSGLAGKVRDKLKELGYKTATPGNNSKTDIEQTEIHVKEGSQSAALLQRLILDLAPDYEAKESNKLDSKSTNDAEVIIGAK